MNRCRFCGCVGAFCNYLHFAHNYAHCRDCGCTASKRPLSKWTSPDTGL